MGRELRKVPCDWAHPKTDQGYYQPMFDRYYGDALSEWLDNHSQWEAGTHPDLADGTTTKDEYPFYAMWHGNPPDIEYYQKRKYSEDELTHIQLYEITSEGTPLSPVFPASHFDALCEWAAENATTFANYKATKEQWSDMLKDGLVYHQSGNMIFI